MSNVSIRFRVDLGPACAIGPGKIALLEHIGRDGSLSQAARDLKMSYRRAWLLLQSVNGAFTEPTVMLTTGGRGGGGAALTPFGERLIAAYRGLEAEVARRARAEFGVFARKASTAAAPEAASRRPLQRHAAPGTRTRAAARPARRASAAR
jgi:molybdate transport system regulatory protein